MGPGGARTESMDPAGGQVGTSTTLPMGFSCAIRAWAVCDKVLINGRNVGGSP